MTTMQALISQESIEQKIFLIRGHKVMLDRDLAVLYDVPTKQLNRQVQRNKERFPEEFMFRLSQAERDELVSNWHRLESMKHSSVLPHAFTEHGVAMLASVLKSKRAVKISILIVKTFVKLRELISTHKELAQRLGELEKKFEKHDQEIHNVFEAIRQLLEPPPRPARRIGFNVK